MRWVSLTLEVFLGHNVRRNHPTGLADIQLMRPAAGLIEHTLPEESFYRTLLHTFRSHGISFRKVD